MKITYRNGFRDWLAFQAYCAPRNPIIILTSVGFFLFVTFEVVLPAMHGAAGVPLFASVIAFILVELLLIAFILGFLAAITIIPMISRGGNKLLYCERTLSTGAETFFTESEYSRSETKWSVVQKLVRTPSHIFMFLGQHSAFVVPRRAFEDTTEWEEFYQECQENKSEAKRR